MTSHPEIRQQHQDFRLLSMLWEKYRKYKDEKRMGDNIRELIRRIAKDGLDLENINREEKEVYKESLDAVREIDHLTFISVLSPK